MILLAFQQVSLVPDGTVFIHIALILIMIWVLNRTLFRPVNRILEARARKTGGQASEAQEILKNVEEKQLRYDEAMRAARGRGKTGKSRRGEAGSRRTRRPRKPGIRTAKRNGSRRDCRRRATDGGSHKCRDFEIKRKSFLINPKFYNYNVSLFIQLDFDFLCTRAGKQRIGLGKIYGLLQSLFKLSRF